MATLYESDPATGAKGGGTLRERLRADGFAVVPGLIPPDLCDAAIDAIGAFLKLDVRNPRDWYARRLEGHGIVPLHHAQALWDIRQHPAVYAVFTELLERTDLWVSHDRASFKAPRKGWREPVRISRIHWDGDPRDAGELRVQGVIYLTDTAPNQGAFCCVPGIYRDIDSWLAVHPDDLSVRHPDVGGHEVVRVGAPAGSLVLWHRRMPHSSAPNELDKPRFTVYVTMDPAGDEPQRGALADAFLRKMPPAWAIRQNVDGQQLPEPGPPATLTALGRKLTGLDPW